MLRTKKKKKKSDLVHPEGWEVGFGLSVCGVRTLTQMGHWR